MVDDGQSVQMSREVPLCCRTHPATLSNAQCARLGKLLTIQSFDVTKLRKVLPGTASRRRVNVRPLLINHCRRSSRPTTATAQYAYYKATVPATPEIELMKKCAFCGGRQNDEVGFDWTETTPACCQRQSNSWLVAQNLFRGQCVRIILVQMYSLQRKQAVSRCSSSKHPE
ncbi:hypothetical protein TPS_03888 [Trichinella pseudospiralis]